MQNLYSDQSYVSVDRQLKRRLVLLSAVLAVLLGVFIWAMIARIDDATRNGFTPMSIRRVTADGASFVCSVLNTMCPVRAA